MNMSDSIIEKELNEIEKFINNFNFPTIVFREGRKIEVISEDIDSVDDKMRERFDTEVAATVTIIGEGNIKELYNVPKKYQSFNVIVFEIKKTRSERGFDPVVESNSNIRGLNQKEIKDIDRQLRESDMHINGLTRELYEDLKKLEIPDL